ncbi:MAG TPA: MTH938/NDUFAF3 family protein [Xanthobacteraceae bacterium]|nr:MTH938/NDUFAF3 family protein [Xanthobacteraceae bacterium]
MTATPHLPRRAPIDAYGGGRFSFAGMSHRGSLLCLPSGIWAWAVATTADIDATALAPVIAEAGEIELFLLGTGASPWLVPEALRWQLRDRRIVVEAMPTGAAVRTYNIVLGENRRVAAGLIAVA